MLDGVSYPLNIAKARLALTDYVGGITDNRPNPRTTRAGWGSYTVDDDTSPVQLLYKLENLYIEGFRNGAGHIFLHRDSGYSIVFNTRFGFGNEYKELGYDRVSAITVTLDNVNGALATVYNATAATKAETIKRAYLILAIAFAEAVRFDDVLKHIIAGTPIDDLDWTKHKDKSKIRVVQS